jgi:hypothetical protein
VDQYLNNRQNEILWKLLANPADTGHLYVYNLQRLVQDFPQSGLLHALLQRSDSEQTTNHAAAYFSPKTLYSLVNAPERLSLVSDSQVIQELSDVVGYGTVEENDGLPQNGEISGLNAFNDDTAEPEHHFILEPEAISDEITGDEHTMPDENEVAELSSDETEPLNTGDITEDIAVADPDEKEVSDLPAAEVEYIDTEDTSEEIAGIAGEKKEISDLPTDKTEAISVEDNVEQIADIEPEQEEEAELSGSEAGLMSAEDIFEQINSTGFEEEVVVSELSLDDDTQVTETLIEEDKEDDQLEAQIDEEVNEGELVIETGYAEQNESQKDIEDDIYDEIVGIEDISFAPVAKPANVSEPNEETFLEAKEASEMAADKATEGIVQKERVLNLDDEAEKLIVGNIAATDYFVFDRAVGDRRQNPPIDKQVEPVENESAASTFDTANEQANGTAAPEAENQEVSKYNDDKMPYTFMWWLDKTRKEHAGIYQPFKLDTTEAIRHNGASELQQQYYENIFHLNSVEELDRSTAQQTIEFDMKSKEDRIIKRFITEEPHIKPPSNEKLDNENKAKKSAEDQDELVTETLARIYSDQMLYHKAINTYKKLMLKFPEKSRYFASQIEQLERKTN